MMAGSPATWGAALTPTMVRAASSASVTADLPVVRRNRGVDFSHLHDREEGTENDKVDRIGERRHATANLHPTKHRRWHAEQTNEDRDEPWILTCPSPEPIGTRGQREAIASPDSDDGERQEGPRHDVTNRVDKYDERASSKRQGCSDGTTSV